MLPRRDNKLPTLSETMEGIQSELDEREEEQEIGRIDAVAPAPRAIDVVAPALRAIVQPQRIHLLKGTTIGLNDSIKPSKRLRYM
jgi:hypothetical protein